MWKIPTLKPEAQWRETAVHRSQQRHIMFMGHTTQYHHVNSLQLYHIANTIPINIPAGVFCFEI